MTEQIDKKVNNNILEEERENNIILNISINNIEQDFNKDNQNTDQKVNTIKNMEIGIKME